MRNRIVSVIKRSVGRYGYELVRVDASSVQWDAEQDAEQNLPPDFDQATSETVLAVREFTMTSPERLFTLCNAVRHVVAHRVPGAIVECGVWRGGSMMAAARTLLELRAGTRPLYLFDTYEGMPEPTDRDVDFVGRSALEKWNSQRRSRFVPREARASLPEVRAAMSSVGYDATLIHYVKGMVEETIPAHAPDRIALLRLDTDYYESTRHELFELYPRLTPNGVLIIDDFGHFKGAEKAVLEFLEETGEPILLHRVDYSGRVGVKPWVGSTAS